MERTWNDLTVKSLREIAKEQGLRGYSKLPKKDLIRWIRREFKARGGTKREMHALLETKPLSARSPARKSILLLPPISISESFKEENVQEYAKSLLDLPNEVLLELMDRMDEDLLARVCLTNQRFYHLCQRPSIQRRLNLRIPGYRKALEKIQKSKEKKAEVLELHVKIVPPEIGTLVDLKILDLSDSNIMILPPEIGNLSALENLLLNDNNLTTLPPEIGNLSSLENLELDYNHLTSLPPEIGNLSALKNLLSDDNHLTILPPEIGNLFSLQLLSFQKNQLTFLPPEIGNLFSLKELILEHNNLTILPPEIGNLSSLQKLDLDNNHLTSLPPEMGNLSSLEELDLSRNPMNGDKHYESKPKVQKFLSML